MYKDETLSLLVIDSELTKIIPFTFEEKGIYGNKLINGRKKTILVDTLDLPRAIKVTTANISDNQTSILTIDLLKKIAPRLEKITADVGYKNTFINYVKIEHKIEVEIGQGRPVKNQKKGLLLKSIAGR